MRTYYVYILANPNRTLYVGMTNDLRRRLQEHKSGFGADFTRRYAIGRLVYWESTSDVRVAIEREKQIKGWRRAKKVALIESMNPAWKDLGVDG